MRGSNIVERVLWVSIFAAAIGGCGGAGASADDGAGGGNDDGFDLGTGGDDDGENDASAEGEMRASDAETLVRMTLDATRQIRQGKGALTISDIQSAAQAVTSGNEIQHSDTLFACEDDCYGDTERGGCWLDGCGSGTFWLGGKVEWTPSTVWSDVTMHFETESSAFTYSTKFDIEDDGAGVSGEVVLETEASGEDDSLHWIATLRYDDACAEGGFLDVDFELEDDGETSVDAAYHAFDEACD